MTADLEARQRRGALAILREGRCTIRVARDLFDHPAIGRPTWVEAAVQSSRPGGPTYAVDLDVSGDEDGETHRWLCTCSPTADTACAHVLSVQLVTGWGDA